MASGRPACSPQSPPAVLPLHLPGRHLQETTTAPAPAGDYICRRLHLQETSPAGGYTCRRLHLQEATPAGDFTCRRLQLNLHLQETTLAPAPAGDYSCTCTCRRLHLQLHLYLHLHMLLQLPQHSKAYQGFSAHARALLKVTAPAHTEH